MTAQAMSAGTAATHSGSGRQPASAVRQDAPNPLYQEGYSMTDTTDQQAVTVAQIDEDARRSFYDECRGGLEDGDLELLDRYFARHRAKTLFEGMRSYRLQQTAYLDEIDRLKARLASVSSASAELATATSVDDDYTRAFIAGWNATRDHSDFDMALHYWMLSSVSLPTSPEPVPATNQAGEVERLRAVIRDAANRLDVGVDRVSDIAGDLLAALATQPATSQSTLLPQCGGQIASVLIHDPSQDGRMA